MQHAHANARSRHAGRDHEAAEPLTSPLSLTLAALLDEMTEQRGTVTHWRATLSVLRGFDGALGEALLDYRAELAALDGRLVRLAHAARRLKRLAGADD